MLAGDALELGAPVHPPRRSARRHGGREALDLLPGGAEHVVGRRVAHDHVVQAAHQPVALLLVHHESDVEVVRRLRDQVDALLLEQLERVAEAVQRGADTASDQAHRRARADDLDAAQLRERRHQRLEGACVERVGGRVERHGDRGLGRGHEVHRQAVLLEHREGVAEEAHLVPHPERVHRDQRDALLGAHRLDPRATVAAGGGDHRASEVGLLRGVHRQRNRILLDRQDAARMQHLGAARGDFLRFVVVERLEQPRVRHRARVGGEHARHVGPDLEPPGVQLRREVAARGVRAAATEQHGLALGVAGDEALREQHAAALGEPLLQRRVGLEHTGGGEVVRARRGARALFGVQHRAGIEPLHVESFARRGRPRRCASPSARPSPSRARATGR